MILDPIILEIEFVDLYETLNNFEALFVVIRLLASFFSILDTKSSPPNYSEDMSKSRKQL